MVTVQITEPTTRQQTPVRSRAWLVVLMLLSCLLVSLPAPAMADTPTHGRRTIDGDTSDYLVVTLTDASVAEYHWTAGRGWQAPTLPR